MHRFLTAALLAALLATATTPMSAQSVFANRAPLVSETGYGAAVAVGDHEIFVAEPLNISREGVVYVYRKDAAGAWVEVSQLRAPDAEASDRFGRALATDGNRLLVGATSIQNTRGGAYIFRRTADGSWQHEATLHATDGVDGDALGRSAALVGDLAYVGAAGVNDAAGAVYVFRRNPSNGSWSQVAKLTGSETGENALFGISLAAHGAHVAVGGIGVENSSGAVWIFAYDAESGTWVERARLEVSADAPRGQFGAAIALAGDHLLVGAPVAARNAGAVYPFHYSGSAWSAGEPLRPADSSFQRYGSSVAVAADRALIGAPFADRFAGAVHALALRDGVWTATPIGSPPEVDRGDQFGGALALGASVAAVGMTGDDYGDGTAVVFERTATDQWQTAGKIFSEAPLPAPIAGGKADCTEGSVSGFLCSEVDVVSFLPLNQIGAGRGVRLNDVWGWTDPESGKEYALVGRLDATVFIDLSDPANPVYLGELPKTEGSPGSTWRDIKVYRNHAFIVSDGAGDHGMQVFDLTRLRDVTSPPVMFDETAHYDGIRSAHNIVINEETGFAYSVGSSGGGETCGGGLHMIDIREPAQPTFAGCFAHEGTGRRGTGYSHDAQCVLYHGPDTEHAGREICVGANETALSIADVTDKDNPVPLATATYPNVGYTHQGWLTEDHRFFYSNDELDELNGLTETTRTLIWDVTDLDDPVLVREYFHETGSTDHNLYVHGRFMYQANNTSGLRILDISDPANPVPIGFFDPVPHGNDVAGFDGTWSSYPFFGSGVIVVTSRREGVFFLKRREIVPIP